MRKSKKRRRSEELPNFTVTNLSNDLRTEVKEFFVICQRPRKVVILLNILEGEIKNGDLITLSLLSGTAGIQDKVRRIEREKKAIDYAVKNENVGICLTETSIHALRKLNAS